MRDAEPEVRCALDLVAAAGGERQAFERLVTGINRNPIGQVAMTVSLFGLFRDATLATDTARHARGRFTAPDDVVRVSRAATTGMVYVPEVTSGFVSLLHPAPAHPGVHAWAALLEHWSGLPSLTELQRLDLLTAASRLGSETARIDLQRAVETVEDPNESRWADGNVLGATVGHAIGELRRRSPLLDKAMLERFLRADQVNMATAGVTAIAAHGDLDALRRLVVAHGDPAAGHAQDALANAIEVLSARVGVAVAADSGRYVL